MNVAERLRQRGAPLLCLPLPEAPEDDMDMAQRHTFSGEDLARMLARMAAALRRLGLKPGTALMLARPRHTLEQWMAWLAALVSGCQVRLADALPSALPEDVGALLCPPQEREAWQPLAAQAEVKLATLGGHWEGSFFMLQMVQQRTAEDLAPGVEVGHAWWPDAPQPLALSDLLERAAARAKAHGLADAPAVLASLPALASPAMQEMALAALLHADAPLYWLPPAARQDAANDTLSGILPHDALVLTDDDSFLRQLQEAGALHGLRGIIMRDQA